MKRNFQIFVGLILVVFIIVYNSSIYLNDSLKNSFGELINSKFNFWHQNEEPKQNRKHRIFCIILTKPADINSKASVLYESWVHKCDDYRFLTLLPKNGKNDKIEMNYKYNLTGSYSFRIGKKQFIQRFTYIKLLQPPGFISEEYKKLTEKIYLAFKYIFKKYEKFDWYLKCDDDTFVNFENLREFLSNKSSNLPVSYGRLVGHYINNLTGHGFLSGGAGYVMSKEAFFRLGTQLNENMTFCRNSGAEDVDVSSCLGKLKSKIGYSLDKYGRCRFHSNHIFSVYPNEYKTTCCSDYFISYHRIKPIENVQLYSILSDPTYNHTFESMLSKLNEFKKPIN